MKITRNSYRNLLGESSAVLKYRKRTELFKDPNKIFLGNLSMYTTEKDLENICIKHGGDVAHIKIPRDYTTKKSQVFSIIILISLVQ